MNGLQVSFAVSCPVIFVSVFHGEQTVLSLDSQQCNLSNKLIMILGSLVAFFIPQLVMGIMMTKTLLLLRQQAKWSAGKRGATYQVPLPGSHAATRRDAAALAGKRTSTPGSATEALLIDGKTGIDMPKNGRSQSHGNTTAGNLQETIKESCLLFSFFCFNGLIEWGTYAKNVKKCDPIGWMSTSIEPK